MTMTVGRLLLWSPRILGIVVSLFIGLFALDAFSQGRPFIEALPDFVIHLIPAFVLLALVGASWRRVVFSPFLRNKYDGGGAPFFFFPVLWGLWGLGVLFCVVGSSRFVFEPSPSALAHGPRTPLAGGREGPPPPRGALRGLHERALWGVFPMP